MYGYIYKTTDTETNLIYVGQKKSTVFLGNRYVGSGTTIRAIQHNTDFHPDRFDVQLLDTADSSDELNQKEIFWIQKLDAQNPKVGYNRCKGGASNFGFAQSDHQKSTVSQYMRTRHISDTTKKKMSDSAQKRTANRQTNSGKRWVHNDSTECLIDKHLLSEYINKGYIVGRIPKTSDVKQLSKERYSKSTYVIKENVCKLVLNEEVETYIERGWTIGRHYNVDRGAQISQGKKGKIKIIHTASGKIKYINKNDLPQFASCGYVPSRNYSR